MRGQPDDHRRRHRSDQEQRVQGLLGLAHADRAAGQDLLQLAERDERPPKRDRSDDRGEQRCHDDVHGRRLAVVKRRKAVGVQEFRQRDQRDRAAAHPVEQSDQLRHRGHLGQPGRRHTQRHTHQQARDDQRPVVGVANRDQRGDHRDRHARRGDPVAPHGGPWAGQAHQAVDEQRERDDIEDRDEVVHFTRPFAAAPSAARPALATSALAGFLPLNMPSMRSVTTKPPTTLSVPNTSATNKMICSAIVGCSRPPSTTSAPKTTTPWIAFVPDINGVCRVLGTLEITAKPTNPASTRIARLASSWSYIVQSSLGRVTHAPATTSSSKSGASRPSLISSSSSAVMFLAYSSLACSGIVAGRFSGAAIVTSWRTPVSPARSTTTLPAAMPATASAVTSRGAGRPGTNAVVITTSKPVMAFSSAFCWEARSSSESSRA